MNLKQKFFACLLLLVGNPVFAEGSDYWGKYRRNLTVGSHIILAKKVANPNAKVFKKFPASKFTHFSIDLDQNGSDDYIVEKKGQYETCFVRSDLKIQSCEKTSFEMMDGFAYEFFFSAGKNQMLFLLDLSGDEETSEFFIHEFDPKTWKRNRITSINTLIQVETKKYKGIYWGYPWDIYDLPVTVENGAPSIPIVFDNGFENEPNGTKGPAFVFVGTPTQGEGTGYYSKLKSKIKTVRLSDLESRLRAGR